MLIHSLPGRSKVDIVEHSMHLTRHTLLPGHDVAWHMYHMYVQGIKSMRAAACNAVGYM